MPLGLELAREAFEAPNREAREAAYLRQLPADGGCFGLNAFADGPPHLVRERRPQLRGEHGEILDSGARSVERRIDLGVPIRALFHGLEPRLRPLDRRLLHGFER